MNLLIVSSIDCPELLQSLIPYSFSIGRNGRSNAQMTRPAAPVIAAISRKKPALSMLLQKLPSQPDKKLPVKLVASQTPIIIERIRPGATFDTSDRLTGDR